MNERERLYTTFIAGYTFYVVIADKDGRIRDIIPQTSRSEARKVIRETRKVATMFDKVLYLTERVTF